MMASDDYCVVKVRSRIVDRGVGRGVGVGVRLHTVGLVRASRRQHLLDAQLTIGQVSFTPTVDVIIISDDFVSTLGSWL